MRKINKKINTKHIRANSIPVVRRSMLYYYILLYIFRYNIYDYILLYIIYNIIYVYIYMYICRASPRFLEEPRNSGKKAGFLAYFGGVYVWPKVHPSPNKKQLNYYDNTILCIYILLYYW